MGMVRKLSLEAMSPAVHAQSQAHDHSHSLSVVWEEGNAGMIALEIILKCIFSPTSLKHCLSHVSREEVSIGWHWVPVVCLSLCVCLGDPINLY